MIMMFFQSLFGLGLLATAAFLFLSLILASEVGYRLGRRIATVKSTSGEDVAVTSTLTAGMIALLAFTLGLSISYAQSRFEARRDLVQVEANVIGTAWLRTALIDNADGHAIAADIEDYARVRLAFTVAASEAGVPALLAQTQSLQTDIWRHTEKIVQNAPNPITATLVNALNEMFDASSAQQFAYESRVPADILMMLYFGTLLAIGALGYQLGLVGKRQVVLIALLLIMWSGGMSLIVDLNQPRLGRIRVDATPLILVVQSFHTPGGPATGWSPRGAP
ncbi:MAG TPA: hypothetical protein VNC39_15435 [Acidocella sp.]|jgi:hypothetical protein|uniref:bestrophin-like domain n=1 Tax=Acidocella sp. TaxID=50710 RepID=UPI002C84E10D|nr:hypothetical protein [Acidocella sp.]HVE23363.1 hypothetical protein [Acidocella sp.]